MTILKTAARETSVSTCQLGLVRDGPLENLWGGGGGGEVQK